MCSSPIINHTIQHQHSTSRLGLSPRQPEILSLQMALGENRYEPVSENGLSVQFCSINKNVCSALSNLYRTIYVCVGAYKCGGEY